MYLHVNCFTKQKHCMNHKNFNCFIQKLMQFFVENMYAGSKRIILL